MSALAEHAQLALAIELLRRGARTSIVHQETGVSRAKLRTLYREIRGRSPPSGQLPESAAVFVTSRHRQVQVSLFARLYEAMGGPRIYQALDIRMVMAAHTLYAEMVAGPGVAPSLDINGAWMIARDLRSGAATLHPCRRCDAPFIVCQQADRLPKCPICAERAGGPGRRT